MSITPSSLTIDRWGSGRFVQVVVGLSKAPLQTLSVALALTDSSVTANQTQLTFGPGLPTSVTITLTGTTYGPNSLSMIATPSDPGIQPESLFITRPNFALPITSGLEFWFKADGGALNGSGVAASSPNEQVAQLMDMSSNGRSMIQNNSNNQPKFQLNQQNGLPGLLFDGADDFLDFSSQLSINDMSIYWVGRFLEFPSNASGFFHGIASNYAANNFSAGLYWFQGGDIVAGANGTFAANTPYNIQIMRAGSSWQLIVNGQAKTVSGNAVAAVIKGIGKSFADYSNMIVHEFVIFSRQLNSAEQTQMNSYLSRWGI
jgi:hypothetical protein